MTDFIIFTDYSGAAYLNARSLGPYRIASECERHGFSTEVIDFTSFLSVDEAKKVISHYCTNETLAFGWASNFTGFNSSFYNKTVDYNDVKQIIDTFGPYYKKEDEIELISWVKETYPNIKIICGGSKSTRLRYYGVDFYVFGYADDSIIALLNSIKTNDFSNLKLKRIKGLTAHSDDGSINDEVYILDSNHDYIVNDVDKLITTWSDSYHIRPYEWIPVETARGCIFSCKFCAHPFLGKKKFDYIKSEDALYEEISNAMSMTGATNFSLMDDTFNDSIHKVKKFNKVTKRLPKDINFSCFARLDLIIRFPEMLDIMVESGLKSVYFGIESFHEYAAKSIGKGIDRNIVKNKLLEIRDRYPHLRTFASLIVGLPGETLASNIDSFKWIIDNQAVSDFKFHPLYLKYSDTIEKYINQSAFEKNPEKYGYRMLSDNLFWENDNMTYVEAANLAFYLTNEGKKFNKPAGWEYALHHSAGPLGPKEADKYYKDINWNKLIKSKFIMVNDYYHNKLSFVPEHIRFGLDKIKKIHG